MAQEVTNLAGSISVVPSHSTVIISTFHLFLSHSTSLISAVTVSLSLPLVRPALVLTHALHILFLFLFLCPRHHSSQLTSSHSSLGVKYHSSHGERAVQELFFIFHLFKFILPLCVLLFISLPTDLEQLSNRTGSSALTITTKSLQGF